MTQKDIFNYEQTLKATLKAVKEQYVNEAKQKYIGKNFLSILDELAETENIISIERGNVTIDVETNRIRINKIDLPVLDKTKYECYNAIIKDILLTTVTTKNKELLDENKTVGCVYGLHFILDDSEELVID